ncbi:sulfatase-like hydrolase/transferase [Paenibacillus thermotolerans]|uniref:sulfatase-like hydrolase/transferase n=1 Tax=Paenibacillus thermotolerans TaxID=3027807 RepID=UPI002367D19C|nr:MULTISPECIES: sulfatase-like hydrolase/transferase [unclassified Paenibacillus]
MERPNVLFITSHDLGRHLNSYGATSVRSDCLDALARSGVMFSNAFTTAPQCSPARSSIMTGKYPHSNGVMGLAHAEFAWYLPQEETPLPEWLKKHGYRTALIGTQHVARKPSDIGFEEAIPGSLSKFASASAVDWLEKYKRTSPADRRPFYLEIGFEEAHRHYSQNGLNEPDASKGTKAPRWLSDYPGVEREMAALQGDILELDKAIRKVLDKVDELGLRDNTLIVFTSDHGLDFPRAKGTLYDPGIEVPLIVHWPNGGLTGGRVYDPLISHIDIMPSILEALGLPQPQGVQGRSFLPLLEGKHYERRTEIFAEKTYHTTYDPLRCVRTERYKLIMHFNTYDTVDVPIDAKASPAYREFLDEWVVPNPYCELYDLKLDPLEKRSVADAPEYREIRKELLRKLHDWMHRTDDPLLKGPVPSPQYFKSIDILQGYRADLPRSRPESQGVDPSGIRRFLEKIDEKRLELHGFMLLRHGHVIAEESWLPYRNDLPHMMFSLSKSFTSTAIGLAADEGTVSLDDRVVSFFPELAPGEKGSNLSKMTVRDLLMMGTGHAQDTMEAMLNDPNGNWAKAFLSLPVEYEPGTHFVYNSGATYMLSAILLRVTGQSLLTYLQPRLFEPLGINDPTWEICPRGVDTGGWGLYVTVEDIAKFGQLYLQNGVWEGRCLLSEEWIGQAVSKQISNGEEGDSDWTQGYGYQFWRCRHGAYRGDGAFGQFCVVMPAQDAVFVCTAGTNEMQAVLNEVWEHLLPSMTASAPIPADESEPLSAIAAMQDGTLERSVDPAWSSLESPFEHSVSDTAYRLGDNEEGWSRIRFTFHKQYAIVRIITSDGPKEFRFGRGHLHYERSPQPFRGANLEIACGFSWKSDRLLELRMRYVTTPFGRTVMIDWQNETSLLLESLPNLPNGLFSPFCAFQTSGTRDDQSE